MVVGADLVFWVQIIITEREQVNHTCNSLSESSGAPSWRDLAWSHSCPRKQQFWPWQRSSFPLSGRKQAATWNSAHTTVLWAHYGAVCRTSSKDIISWGKLKPAGAKSNSVRDALLFSRWGTLSIGKQRSRWLLKRLAGDTTAAQKRPRRNTNNTTQNTGLSGWHLGTSTYLVMGNLAQEPLLLQTEETVP